MSLPFVIPETPAQIKQALAVVEEELERRRPWRLRLAVASLTALLIFALCVYTIWRLYTVLLGAL